MTNEKDRPDSRASSAPATTQPQSHVGDGTRGWGRVESRPFQRTPAVPPYANHSFGTSRMGVMPA